MSMPKYKRPYPGAEPCWTEEQAEELLKRFRLSPEEFCELVDALFEVSEYEYDSTWQWSMESLMAEGGAT